MKITKKIHYEKYLNQTGCNKKASVYDEVPAVIHLEKKYGTWLKNSYPTLFNGGFKDFYGIELKPKEKEG